MPPAHENPMDVYMMLLKDSRSADDVVKKWSAAVHAERFGVDVTYLDGDSASSRPSHHTNSDTNALASGSDSMWGAGLRYSCTSPQPHSLQSHVAPAHRRPAQIQSGDAPRNRWSGRLPRPRDGLTPALRECAAGEAHLKWHVQTVKLFL